MHVIDKRFSDLPLHTQPDRLKRQLSISFGDIAGGALNIGSLGLLGKGPLDDPLDQPKNRPESVQSQTQRRFDQALEGIFLDEQLDEEGNVTGFGPSATLSSAFQPGSRAALFKGTRQGARRGARKEAAATTEAFGTQRDLLLKNFEDTILPLIRERAGARGQGVGTGVQIGGVRAAEDALLGLGVEEAQAQAGIVQRREANLQRSREVGASAEAALLDDLASGGLRQGGVAGTGQPLFGDSIAQQGAQLFGAIFGGGR